MRPFIPSARINPLGINLTQPAERVPPAKNIIVVYTYNLGLILTGLDPRWADEMPPTTPAVQVHLNVVLRKNPAGKYRSALSGRGDSKGWLLVVMMETSSARLGV